MPRAGRQSEYLPTGLFAGLLVIVCVSSPSATEESGDPWPTSWTKPCQTASQLGIQTFTEAPSLKRRVAAGELPPLKERLPHDPIVVEPSDEPGRYGGTLSCFQSDVILINSPEGGCTIGPNASEILPNIFSRWEFSEGGRHLTLHIRKGIKWSDGHPFGADDFMFDFYDIVRDADITPTINPRDKDTVLIKIDDHTLRYEYAHPTPFEINKHAHSGHYFYEPKHFLRAYHPRYQGLETIEQQSTNAHYMTWMAYFYALRARTRREGPFAPTLSAYYLKSRTPLHDTYARNPYYFKVDTNGQQLPYIDTLKAEYIANSEIRTAKASTGQVDFAGIGMNTQDFPLFKIGELNGAIKTLQWNRLHGSDVLIQPNLNCEQPEYRQLFNDVRFRRALSLSINRQELNDIIYFGRGTPRQATVIPSSRFFDKDAEQAYADFNLAKANSLLDDMGLKDTSNDGLREFPNGEPLVITLEFIDLETPKATTVELCVEYWRAAGLDIRLKELARALMESRARANKMQMTIWHADRTTDILFPIQPYWYVPIHKGWEECHWPLWAGHYLTSGKAGEPPPPDYQQLVDWWLELTTTIDSDKQTELGKSILKFNADNVLSIGTIGLAPKPLVIKEHLNNVVRKGLWGWDNRFLLSYYPCTWYFDEEGRP